MGSQQYQQTPPADDVTGLLDVVLHRDPQNKLDQQLRSESDTHFDTKSFPSENFFAGSYGTAGPSTATPSSPPSNGIFSANSGTHTDPTSYTSSHKGKSVRKPSDQLSVGATKGSSTDETSASDTDHTGPITVKHIGSHFEAGQARQATKDRKKYKVNVVHRGRRLDPNLRDTHTVLKHQVPDRDASSLSERDVEAYVSRSLTVVPPGSNNAKIVATLIGFPLLAILGSLLFALIRSDGEGSEAISITLTVMLAVSVVGLSIAVVRTHGENPKGARCLFSIGMAFIACMASLLALSIGRPAAECNSVLVAVLAFSILLRGELETLLTWL